MLPRPSPLRTDPIAALATPPGRSALGIVRITGDGAWAIAAAAIGESDPAGWTPRQARVVTVTGEDGVAIDHGVLLPWQSPASSTGEDLVEFIGHGSPEGLHLVLDRFLALGARPAEPGEFTRRAFLNGKLTLDQAEAVVSFIDARSAAAARAALRVMGGELTTALREISDSLRDELGLVELDLDFAEEELRVYDPAAFVRRMESLASALARLEDRARAGHYLRQGVHVVLVGPANVGKSTLFNRWLGHDRALVSSRPGTTRDFLDADVPWDGLPVRLYDTAGFRLSEDDLEIAGIRRAWEKVEQADLLLWLTSPPHWELPDDPRWDNDPRLHIVRNMADRPEDPPDAVLQRTHFTISADTGEGVPELRHALIDHLLRGADPDDTLGLEARHQRLLTEARHALDRAAGLAADQDGEELIASELRAALNALSAITGDEVGEDVLNRIFDRFCIGK